MQLDAARFTADQGDFDDLRWRRFRFGFTTHFVNGFSARFEGDFDLNDGGRYNRMTDGYIGWSPGGDWELRVLKHSAGFTLDGAPSSTRLLTPQRNNLTNNLWFDVEYFTGASIKGSFASDWRFKAGLFSANGDDEFGSWIAGSFGLLSLARELPPGPAWKTGRLRIDYVYNDGDPGAGTAPMDQVLSLVSEWEGRHWGLRTDLAFGVGMGDQSDVWGVVGMPYYSFDERLQLVFRYTHVSSDEPNGVRLARYEREITNERGDRYDELYAGVNLFFYGHKLKWQTGLEYARMLDRARDGGQYDGWGLSSVLRIYW